MIVLYKMDAKFPNKFFQYQKKKDDLAKEFETEHQAANNIDFSQFAKTKTGIDPTEFFQGLEGTEGTSGTENGGESSGGNGSSGESVTPIRSCWDAAIESFYRGTPMPDSGYYLVDPDYNPLTGENGPAKPFWTYCLNDGADQAPGYGWMLVAFNSVAGPYMNTDITSFDWLKNGGVSPSRYAVGKKEEGGYGAVPSGILSQDILRQIFSNGHPNVSIMLEFWDITTSTGQPLRIVLNKVNNVIRANCSTDQSGSGPIEKVIAGYSLAENLSKDVLYISNGDGVRMKNRRKHL